MLPTPYSDAWLAAELAARLSGRIAWDARRQVWLAYRNPLWREDIEETRIALALEIAYDLRDALLPALAPEIQKIARRAIARLEQAGTAQRVLDLARHQLIAAIPLTPQALLGARNGVILLHDDGTHTFRPATAQDWLTRCVATAYDPSARAPQWERFLSDIAAGDGAWIEYVQRLVGYTLAHLTVEQIFVLCYGSGANGKSAFLSILRAVLGDYARDTPFKTFLVDRRGGASHDDALMALEGARMVTAQEGAVGAQIDEATLKRVTGEGVISGSRKFERTREYIPEFTLWLATNDLPRVADMSPAFWRRVIALPFRASFLNRADRDLPARIAAQEAQGILNWALEGYRRWRCEGLANPPACVTAAIQSWRARANPLDEWLTARCVNDAAASTPASVLFSDYESFCALHNVKPRFTPTSFWQELERQGYAIARVNSARIVRGLRLAR